MKIKAETAPSSNFKDFIIKDRFNRRVLIIIASFTILQFAIFKYIYPFASYIHGDSFSYIGNAYNNDGVSMYMIGYAMFLRVFSVFSTSDLALSTFQYYFILSAALLLLYTLFYFYRPSKVLKVFLFGFISVNPLFLYMGNMVSSDAFFLALSLLWVVLLLWILERPNIKLILFHTIVIYIAFTVRYNALIYLIISCIVFMISPQYLWKKLLGIGAATTCIVLFVLHTGNQYKALTGTWQYSPFAGWQMANNAMYAYRYVDRAERKSVPVRFKALDNNIRAYFDSTRDIKKYPTEGVMASTYYMWSPGMPLMMYKTLTLAKDSNFSDLKKWASMAPLYKAYGLFIISNYPSKFIQYFIWPNTIRYYTPPIEFLEEYNSGKSYVHPIAQKWFGYRTVKVIARNYKIEKKILSPYPILCGTINVVLLMGLLSFWVLEGYRKINRIKNIILLGATIWLLNALFTIFASSAALRFQAFPFMLSTIYASILVDWTAKMAYSKTEAQYDLIHKNIIPA